MDLPELVRLLTDEEQRDLRPVVLRLVASHGQSTDQRTATPKRRLSFAGSIEAGPDFATRSEEVLRRELGGGA
ncbi:MULTISPECIES: hypothetical protein [unclassified Nocardia]|uniref:hypothetical protein n=1 Tax=unclassified Nocardia TaxID=2637762 RepID=UPI001CE46CA1|nr:MULTISPECIES: hypothetical protein [unclassified Nocardia]